VLWESTWQVTFDRVYFTKLRCGRYWFLNEFCCWKLKQIAKLGFGRKNKLSPQCAHIAKLKKISILKMWEIKNVSTLGPMTTLVPMIKEGVLIFGQQGVVACTRETHLFLLWGRKVPAQCLNVWTFYLFWWSQCVPTKFPWSSQCVHINFPWSSQCVHINFPMCYQIIFLLVFSTCSSMSQCVP